MSILVALWIGAVIGGTIVAVFAGANRGRLEARTRAALEPFVNGIDVYNENLYPEGRRLWVATSRQIAEYDLTDPAADQFAGYIKTDNVWAAANLYQDLGGVIDIGDAR